MRIDGPECDGCESGKSILVVGESYSLHQVDLSLVYDVMNMKSTVTVSCNRILQHKTFKPRYLLQSDREPYVQERDAGRLQEYMDWDGNLLLSETIFDPTVIGRRADGRSERQLPAQPLPEFNCAPDFAWYGIRVGAWHTDFNFKSFREWLCSCANIVGPMIQAAAILGASKIGVIGVDMAWPKSGPSHHWGHGKTLGAYPPRSLTMIMRKLAEMRDALDVRGVKVLNLSPITGTPFSKVFGNHDYHKFLQAT